MAPSRARPLNIRPDRWFALVEAAYRPAEGEAEWMKGLIEAARPQLDHGLGVCGFAVDTSNLSRFTSWNVQYVGPLADWHERFAHSTRALTPEVMHAAVRAPALCTASEGLRGLVPARAIRETPYAAGEPDMLRLLAADPSGIAVQLCAPLPAVRSLSPLDVAAGERVGAHIVAGLRLRRRLAAMRVALTDAPDAVLTVHGRVEHAQGEAEGRSARSALRDAASAMVRASSAFREADPRGALNLWRALVAGRWSLIDHYDRDGRRYFVAQRNAPGVGGDGTLTARERSVVAYAALGHSNKLIGYELGLSPSTVATHLSAAARKLRVSSRAALIAASQR